MTCSKCGKAFTPLSCPTCQGALGADTCPACAEGQRLVCTTCGQELEIARVDAARSEGAAPGAVGAPAEPMSGTMADIAAAADSMTPPNTVAAAQAVDVTQPPAHTPVYTQPGSYAPPPPYGTPYGAPPQQPYAGPPPYGMQPPPYGTPGQPYYPLPREKVKLGGWLMAYFVFLCIGLAFSALGLITNLIALNWLGVALELVLYIFPAVMVLLCINKRSLNFRWWFIIRAIIGFVGAVLSFIMANYMNNFLVVSGSQIWDELLGSLPSEYAYLITPEYISAVASVAVGMFIAVGIVLVAWYVCWIVYFWRSKRVAYTFDPRNNPPS